MSKEKQSLSLETDPSIVGFAEDTQFFEQQLVAACMYDQAVVDMCEQSGLCLNEERTRSIVELEDGANNALYLVLRTARLALGTKTPPADLRVLMRFTDMVLNGADLCGVGPQDKARLLNHMIKLQGMDRTMLPLVRKGFSWWLRKKRIAGVINREGSVDSWSPDELTRQINAVTRSVASGNGKTRFSMMEGFVDKKKQPKRLLTGIPRMDATLGGGCPYGASMLTLTVQGGGKTVWAGQLTSGLLLNNGPDIKGLLISTEEDVDEFWARIVCNKLSLDFKMLKDGVDPEELADRHKKEALDLAETFDRQLTFVKWEASGNGLPFIEKLKSIIDDHLQEHGRLDFLVFDWLGAALTEQISKDANNIRIIYDLAAKELCQLARDQDFFCCYLAQASIAQSEGRKKIRANHVAECKSLGEKAQIVLGISGLKTKDDSVEDGSDAFETRQYMFFDKLRKAKGKLLAVDREFHYMRFHFPNNENGVVLNRRPVSTT